MKKALLLIFSWLLFAFSSFCQSIDWEWAESATGPIVQYGRGITTDQNGNVYIAGYFQADSITFGNITLYNGSNNGPYNSGEDMFIVKYSPAGNVIWAKNAIITGYGGMPGFDVASDGIGGIYVTGYFEGHADSIKLGNIVLPTIDSSFFDSYIAKFDTLGNVLWVSTSTGQDNAAYGITADMDGNTYITGDYADAFVGFDGITVYNNYSNSNIFVAKYNSAGKCLWASAPQAYETEGSNRGTGITVDDSDNVFVTGYFCNDSIDFGPAILYNPNGRSNKFFIAKYDSSGNILWAKGAGIATSSEASGSSVVADKSGNVYVAGQTTNTITFDSTTLAFPPGDTGVGNLNFFMAKYSSSGQEIWAKSATGYFRAAGSKVANEAIAFNMAIAPNGIVYVTGLVGDSTKFISFDSLELQAPSYSYIPLFIVAYNSEGKVVGGTVLPSGSSTDGICFDKTGNGYLVDNYESYPFVIGADTFLDPDAYTYAKVLVAKFGGIVIPPVNIVVIDSICANDSVIFNGKAYNVAGSYIDTLQGSGGEDSIVTLILTVSSIASSAITDTICFGQSYLGHDSTGVYIDTLHHVASNGCDSIRTLNLTVKPMVVGYVQQQICPGDTFDGHTVAGNFADTFSIAGGCDSVAVLNLTLSTIATSSISDTICFGQKYFGYDSTGVYVDTLYHATANGCDSVRTLDLVVMRPYTSLIKQRICLGDTFMGHTTAGTYFDTVHTKDGCDSIMTLELQIDTLPAIIPISQRSDTLFTLSGFAVYSWYQDSLTLLSSGSDSFYVISHSGSYYVTISNDTQYCIKRSADITADATGIKNLALSSQHLQIYPNPAQNQATIEWRPTGEQTGYLTVYDLLGRQISDQQVDGTSGQALLNSSALDNGLYVVKLYLANGGVMSGKLTVGR